MRAALALALALALAACGEDDPCGCSFLDPDCPDSPVPYSCEGKNTADPGTTTAPR